MTVTPKEVPAWQGMQSASSRSSAWMLLQGKSVEITTPLNHQSMLGTKMMKV